MKRNQNKFLAKILVSVFFNKNTVFLDCNFLRLFSKADSKKLSVINLNLVLKTDDY